jgi:hypothetical protein
VTAGGHASFGIDLLVPSPRGSYVVVRALLDVRGSLTVGAGAHLHAASLDCRWIVAIVHEGQSFPLLVTEQVGIDLTSPSRPPLDMALHALPGGLRLPRVSHGDRAFHFHGVERPGPNVDVDALGERIARVPGPASTDISVHAIHIDVDRDAVVDLDLRLAWDDARGLGIKLGNGAFLPFPAP